MKASVLRTGILAALLGISVAPINSPAEGTSQSDGRHEAKGHYKSGVVGQSVLSYGGFCVHFGNPPAPCPDSVPYATTVLVHSAEGELVATVTTDEEGYFKIVLSPGTYSLTAYIPPSTGPRVGNVVSTTTFVRVEKKQFAPAYVFSAFLFF